MSAPHIRKPVNEYNSLERTHNPYTPPIANVDDSPRSPQSSGLIAKSSLGPRIILAVGWLVFCGSYSIWSAWHDQRWPGAIFGAVIIVASFGVLFRWSWSQWVIYLFVVWGSGAWLYLLWEGIRAGNFPFETVQMTALSLVPGLSMLFASVWSADIVRRRFRKKADVA